MKKINKKSKTPRIIKPKKIEQELSEKSSINETRPGKLLATIKFDEEPISPINQYKARAIRVGGRWTGTVYLDPKFSSYKERFTKAAKEQYNGPVYSSSLLVVAKFFFQTKRRKDLPNAGKLEFDALNGIVYEDDSQISSLITEKIYSPEKPGCIIQIYSDGKLDWTETPSLLGKLFEVLEHV
jgi:Holliday junction resolvase RusA-like endonuclease